MKNKLNRNNSSDDETTTNSNNNENSSHKSKTRKTSPCPNMMPNLRKYGGINRMVEPVVNQNRIEKFLEQMDLFAVDSVVKIESYRPQSIESVIAGNYEQLNPEKSLIDQIRNFDRVEEPIPEQIGPIETSKIDIELRQSILKRPETTSSIFSPLTGAKNRSTTMISPLYQHLAQLATQLVPVDAFEHTLNTTETKPIKLELEYNDSDYWPVKVRKCQNSNLYQLKLATDTNSTFDSGLDLSKASNWSEKSSPNRVKWFFHDLDRQTHLRSIGWGKENNRTLKRPPENLNLDSLLDQIDPGCNELIFDSKPTFQVNSPCEIFDDETREVRTAVVKRNVNGRLLLDVDGKDKWCFYTDARLNYSGGRVSIENGGVAHPNHQRRNFAVGTYLECLFMNEFYSAKVIRSVQDLYLQVEITSHDSNNSKVIEFLQFYRV